MEQDAVLRGNAPAKIDDKGRLKVPNGFRSPVQQAWGREVFVTSLTGESVRIYPMPVWQQVEAKLAAMPSTHPSRLRFLDRVNYYGQVGEIDDQGRVLIHGRLRESASMTGEVADEVHEWPNATLGPEFRYLILQFREGRLISISWKFQEGVRPPTTKPWWRFW